ncbi:peptidyl-prolyl cis-trans isomerase [Massilia sp. P8910]|uniref:peptidylprolyl isomerase n=1 Tax=Massilia antarctica TaxID=2765360 RepID=UPI001E2E5861|nr:peptidyl-prolyl cis-trans isomerase [Massilia antarctica]MCE3605562.1 peptidyl-prolyl cis-trans isomerase [Massilia antarctica]
MDFHRTSASLGRHCLVLLLALPGAYAATPAAAPAPTSAQETVAQVGGQPVPKALLDALMDANAGRPNPFDEENAQDRQERAAARAALDRQALLGELVTMELMAQEALRLGLHKSAELVAEAELAYKTLLQRDLVRHMLSTMPVTNEDIAQRYQGVPAERQFRIAKVDVATPAAAHAALAALRQGKRLAQLAKRGSGAARPASPAWVMASQMDTGLAQQVAGMAPGQAIERELPQGGWQVVQLSATRQLPKPPLDELRAGLRTQIMQERLGQRIEALKTRADVRLTAERAPQKDAAQ